MSSEYHCPRCGKVVENSHPSNLVENGTYHHCYTCKTEFWVRKEAE